MVGMVCYAAIAILQGVLSPDDRRLIALAKAAVSCEVNHRPVPKPDSISSPSPIFVTIEIDGKVRGCRGGLQALTNSKEQEIVHAAQAASQHDPRYRPLQPSDLRDFKVTITVVERTEEIEDVSGLRPEDGLVLRFGEHTGIVLPWEGKDATLRLHWAFRKAGVPETAKPQLFRLIARRFRG